ncbi:MAG: NifU family protein [Clostridia bacterium]|nr:NifU family protein [Clostridia bacterium]
MDIQDYIENRIRPCLQGDGGEISFAGRKGTEVTVLLQGECSKCLMLERCLKWIEQRIYEDTGEKVTLCGVRKRPYFQEI